MKKKDEEQINMKIFRDILNKLINDDRVKFKFYNNSLLKLDLLQICYNQTNNTLEVEYRDIMGEHLKELREIMNGE